MVKTTDAKRSTPVDRTRFERAHRRLDIVMCGLIALSPLALGGTHPTAAFVLAILTTLICALSLTMHARAQLTPKHAWPIYALSALCAWVLLRATVLGAWTNTPLTAEAWALWPELAERGGIAPGRAALWTARTMTFVGAAWFAAQRFSRSDRAHLPVLGALGAATIVPLVGATQLILNSEKILGIYTPLDWSRTVAIAGPFVNPNQAGALVGIGALAALVIARNARETAQRLTAGIVALPLIAYVALLDARGALLALALAVLTFVFASATELRGRRLRLSAQLVLPIVLCATAALLLYAAPFTFELIDNATLQSKVRIWRESLAVPLHAPVFGFGPRGFQDAFASLGLNASHVWIEDPESGPIQLFSEHGMIVGVAVVAMVLALLVRAQRAAVNAGLAIASAGAAFTVFIVLETITGMGLHASSYLLVAGSAFGVLTGRALRGTRPAWSARAFAPAVAVLGVALWSVAASPPSVRTSLHDSRVPLLEELKTHTLSDPILVERGLARARQTPGRSALIQQMALIYSARGDHARAYELAQGLRTLAPNYAAPQRAAIRVALEADRLDEACDWLQDYATRFSAFPAQELTAVLERGAELDSCVQSAEHRLFAARAFSEAGRTELATALLFQLAAAPDASSEAIVEAITYSSQLKVPELGDLWLEQLLTRDDLREADFQALLRWSKQRSPELRLRLSEHAAGTYTESGEFRLSYAEAFLESLPEDQNGNWYIEFRPVIDACRTLSRGDRPLRQRVLTMAATAAWRAEAWEDVERYYRRVRLQELSRPRHAEALYRLGHVARMNDDLYRARRYYREALDVSGNYQPAIQALQEIGG